jgi:DNA-binding Xre family transcriptional regulator
VQPPERTPACLTRYRSAARSNKMSEVLEIQSKPDYILVTYTGEFNVAAAERAVGYSLQACITELLKVRGLNAMQLMRKANIAYATAYRLSKVQGTAISFDVLDALCKIFEVPVEEILEYQLKE